MVYAVYKLMGTEDAVKPQFYYLGDHEGADGKAAIQAASGESDPDVGQYRTYDASTMECFEARARVGLYVSNTES